MIHTLYLSDDELDIILGDMFNQYDRHESPRLELIEKLVDVRVNNLFHYSASIKATFTGVLKARAVALS